LDLVVAVLCSNALEESGRRLIGRILSDELPENAAFSTACLTAEEWRISR